MEQCGTNVKQLETGKEKKIRELINGKLTLYSLKTPVRKTLSHSLYLSDTSQLSVSQDVKLFKWIKDRHICGSRLHRRTFQIKTHIPF